MGVTVTHWALAESETAMENKTAQSRRPTALEFRLVMSAPVFRQHGVVPWGTNATNPPLTPILDTREEENPWARFPSPPPSALRHQPRDMIMAGEGRLCPR